MIPMRPIDADLPKSSAYSLQGYDWGQWDGVQKEEGEREGRTGDVGLWDAMQNNSYRGILALRFLVWRYVRRSG